MLLPAECPDNCGDCDFQATDGSMLCKPKLCYAGYGLSDDRTKCIGKSGLVPILDPIAGVDPGCSILRRPAWSPYMHALPYCQLHHPTLQSESYLYCSQVYCSGRMKVWRSFDFPAFHYCAVHNCWNDDAAKHCRAIDLGNLSMEFGLVTLLYKTILHQADGTT